MSVPDQPPMDPTVHVDEFMKLYTQHQRRLYVYLLSMVHNVADAEELLQQTSYVLWRKFGEYQPGTHFAAWACRIGYLEVLKFREGRHRRELSLSPDFLERVADKMAAVGDLLEKRTEAFHDCMAKLDELDRHLITRRYAPGASVRTVAAELNRPARSVSKSLVRIRKVLLECIDRQIRQEDRR